MSYSYIFVPYSLHGDDTSQPSESYAEPVFDKLRPPLPRDARMEIRLSLESRRELVELANEITAQAAADLRGRH